MKHIKQFESFRDKINDIKDIGYTTNYTLKREEDLVVYNFSIENINSDNDPMDDDSVYSFVLPLAFAKPVFFENEFLETLDRVKRYLNDAVKISVYGQFGRPDKNNKVSYNNEWLPLDFITDKSGVAVKTGAGSNKVCGIWNRVKIEFKL